MTHVKYEETARMISPTTKLLLFFRFYSCLAGKEILHVLLILLVQLSCSWYSLLDLMQSQVNLVHIL